MKLQILQTSAPLTLNQVYEEGRNYQAILTSGIACFHSKWRKVCPCEGSKRDRQDVQAQLERSHTRYSLENQKTFWSRELLPCLFQSHTPLHLPPLCLQQLNDRYEDHCEEGGVLQPPLLTHSSFPLTQNFFTPVFHVF